MAASSQSSRRTRSPLVEFMDPCGVCVSGICVSRVDVSQPLLVDPLSSLFSGHPGRDPTLQRERPQHRWVEPRRFPEASGRARSMESRMDAGDSGSKRKSPSRDPLSRFFWKTPLFQGVGAFLRGRRLYFGTRCADLGEDGFGGCGCSGLAGWHGMSPWAVSSVSSRRGGETLCPFLYAK